jgi:hypothetical protein
VPDYCFGLDTHSVVSIIAFDAASICFAFEADPSARAQGEETPAAAWALTDACPRRSHFRVHPERQQSDAVNNASPHHFFLSSDGCVDK